MNPENQEDKEVPINMAMLFYMEFHEFRLQKTAAIVNNNLNLAYDLLEEMYSCVFFKCTDPERKEVLKYTNKITTALQLAAKNKRPLSSLEIIQIKDSIRSADREILNLMNRYKMLFPNIDMKMGMDKIRHRYKLGAASG